MFKLFSAYVVTCATHAVHVAAHILKIFFVLLNEKTENYVGGVLLWYDISTR
jgi:hypothetical protein